MTRLPPGRAGASGPRARHAVVAAPDPRRRALLEELPYLYCGEFEQFGPLHLLSDDTLGYAFSFEVPAVDTVEDGEASVSNAITAMLHALPPAMHWQWFLCSNSCVEAQLERYEQQRGQDAASQMFTEAFLARWRAAQFDGFFPADGPRNFYPRSQRIVVALKSEPLGLARPGLSDLITQALPQNLAQTLARLLARADGKSQASGRAGQFVGGVRDVLAAVHAHGFEPSALDSDGVVEFVGSLLYPQRPRRAPRAAEISPAGGLGVATEDTRNAIASLGQIDEITGRGFRSIACGRERHHRVVSMLWQPRAVAPGMLNELVSLRSHIDVCLSACALPSAAAMLQLKARALLNARSTHRFNATEMNARTEALHEVEQRVFADGERILEMRLQIHLAEPSAAEAQSAAEAVCKHLEALEIDAAIEEDIGSSMLLRACLPFAIYPRTEQKLRRRRRVLSRDCADMHPAGGCWTGIQPTAGDSGLGRPSPVVLYSNPLGEPLFIDPTRAEKNPHALVFGQSGSGKSFFVHDYLLHLWRLPEVRLFLISIKADYRKLALLLGRYVEVSLDSEISLNPFGGRPTLENQARWFAALALMLADADSAPALDRDAEVALQNSALSAAQRNWDNSADQAIRETVLEHICLELERCMGPLGRQLAVRLHPYRRGPYRKLFNEPRHAATRDRFIFFNLGNILRQPCAALASFCIFGMVDEVITDPTLRGVPKGLIADEVWALVRNPYAASILERSLKAYRSLGAFAIPIVQDPQDLDTPSGRVMLVNTATKVILPLDRAGQSDLRRYVRLNDRELDIVRNLRLAKRRFSEFFISIDGMHSAKGLLIPDPLRYAVATTDPLDEERIDRLYADCGDMLEAVRRFADEFPYGIARAR